MACECLDASTAAASHPAPKLPRASARTLQLKDKQVENVTRPIGWRVTLRQGWALVVYHQHPDAHTNMHTRTQLVADGVVLRPQGGGDQASAPCRILARSKP